MRKFRLDAIDNNAYLWAKIGLTTLLDRLNISDKLVAKEELFSSIKTCCLFIGYPRSGHSIIGSIIDAHPNALMAHRLDSVKYLEMGYDPKALFYLMYKNSQRFAKSGRKLTAYQYHIPRQWQGRHKELQLIGDQEGKQSALRLSKDPQLLQRLAKLPQVNVRLIHVIRNPFDNISTWALRTGDQLASRAEKYFSLASDVQRIRQAFPKDQLLDIRHEDFLQAPEKTIRELCHFLGLEADPEYIRDCVSIVYTNANKSRHKFSWSPDLIDATMREMGSFDFFDGYNFYD